MQTATRILIICPSWLGDIIMSQSLYKVLKQLYPRCIIDAFAPAWTIPVLKRMEEVDNTIENPFGHGVFDLLRRKAVGRSLKGNYDMAFILPNSFKSALIPYYADISYRRGLKGESRYVVINEMRKNKEDFPLMVQRYVSLAYSNEEVKTASDLMDFEYPSLKAYPPSEELIVRLNLKTDRKFIAIGCGANYGPSKLWPFEYYAAVCEHFIKKGYAIMALGSQKDKDSVEQVLSHIGSEYKPYFYDVAGKTDLTEALDILTLCAGAVVNDSGLMHSLAALDIPQVCIFGSTSTGYTPPLSKKAICVESDEPCHPCFKRECKFKTYACQKNIKHSTVIEKLESLLEHENT